MTATLQFLTREGCHLCDDAIRLLEGVPLEVIDIDNDPILLAEFDERVPVVRDTTTGTVLLEGKITPQQVERLRAGHTSR